jgi:hypothetical protein
MLIPGCPTQLPKALRDPVRDWALAWATSDLRPRVSPSVRGAWVKLLDDWVADSSLPLFVRCARVGRGCAVAHDSGRTMIPADNSPANWALGRALAGQCPTLDQLRSDIKSDSIPIAMILRKKERESAHLKCGLKKAEDLNRHGWKVAHIRKIGLGRQHMASMPIDELTQHFRDFMSPNNMFVVPLAWQGLGELTEVIEAVSLQDRQP